MKENRISVRAFNEHFVSLLSREFYYDGELVVGISEIGGNNFRVFVNSNSIPYSNYVVLNGDILLYEK